MEKCPNCESNKFARLNISSVDGWTSIIHNESGRVTPFVCKECGTLFLGEYDLKKINETEKKNDE